LRKWYIHKKKVGEGGNLKSLVIIKNEIQGIKIKREGTIEDPGLFNSRLKKKKALRSTVWF
jgi:hypothetical protein